MSVLRVFVVDDHPVMRQGIIELLKASGMALSGAAGGLSEALELLSHAQSDVVLVDLTLGPDGDGLDLLEQFAKMSTSPPSLVYSMREDAVSIQRSLDAGSLGYVTKTELWETLVTAIRQVARGETYLSPRARRALDVHVECKAEVPATKLSAREQEVFLLLSQGYSVAEIATRLRVSPRTVESYCSRLLLKLNLRGMRELRRHAIAHRD